MIVLKIYPYFCFSICVSETGLCIKHSEKYYESKVYENKNTLIFEKNLQTVSVYFSVNLYIFYMTCVCVCVRACMHACVLS